MIILYFSKVKILVQRPTHIFAVATVLLITKTDREREGGDRRTDRETETERQTETVKGRQTERQRRRQTNGQTKKKADRDRKRQTQ